jgi:hypothetical protein
MIHVIRVSIAVALIVGAGLVHGAWTSRWGQSAALAAISGKFSTIPMVVGDWNGTSRELSPDERTPGATASLSRVYTNSSRGISVSILLIAGLPGKVSVHTPDVCYSGAGYTLDSPSRHECRYGSDQCQGTFRTALAKRGGTDPSVLRIFWGWNSTKGWTAPDEPRWTFASERAICKLYVVRETWGKDVDAKDDPCNDFLSVFLPELDRLVFSVRR